MPLQQPSPLATLTTVARRSMIRPVAKSVDEHLVTPLRGFAFWAAILLPLTYLPLFFGSSVVGIDLTGADLHLVGTLLALNVIAFLVGHGHNQPSEV